MILSDVGESRVNGYLYVLERSLATFLPATVVRDAVREIESHLRERIDAVGSVADERATLEQILRESGRCCASRRRTPLSARSTRRWSPAASSHRPRLLAPRCHERGWLSGRARPVRRLHLRPRVSRDRPAEADLSQQRRVLERERRRELSDQPRDRFATDEMPAGGYWVIPIGLFLGLGLLVLLQRGARRFLAWWRERSANKQCLGHRSSEEMNVRRLAVGHT